MDISGPGVKVKRRGSMPKIVQANLGQVGGGLHLEEQFLQVVARDDPAWIPAPMFRRSVVGKHQIIDLRLPALAVTQFLATLIGASTSQHVGQFDRDGNRPLRAKSGSS